MESIRQQKVSKLLQKELADIFQKDIKHLFGKAFITVTDVKVTPDLGLARVYLSFMLADNKEKVFEEVNLNKKEIKKLLVKKIAKQLRVIPDLVFYLDETADYAAKMDKLIESLDIPPTEDKTPKDEDE